MRKENELSHDMLFRRSKTENFAFVTTEEVKELKGLIGQERAEAAMTFGLSVEHNSYHIYIRGSKGTGKTTYARNIIEAMAKEKNPPCDWCYVYNFLQPEKAKAVSMPAGTGRALKRDMEEMVEELILQISKAFNSDDYDRQRNEISKYLQEEKNRYLLLLTEYANERDHAIKFTSTGFIFKLKTNDEEMDEDDLPAMDEETKKKLEKYREEVQEAALEVLLKLKNLERVAKKKLLELENRVGVFVINPIIGQLLEKYKDCEGILEHLRGVEKDLLDNIYHFVLDEDEEFINIREKIEGNSFMKRYKINLFIDNSHLEGAPVVMEFNPTMNKLTGSIDYVSENGVMKTSFLQIRPGAIHLANGGYLIIEANKLLTSPYAWDTLKRILQTKEITVENMGSQLGIMDIASIKLEPITIQLKVILIGDEYLYHLLTHYDDDFQKYFKILVDFNEDMERTDATEVMMANFVASYTKSKGLRAFDKESVGRLIEYSSRIVGNQNKLTSRFNKIIEVIVEADQWAAVDNENIISERHIKKAIAEKQYRNDKYQSRVNEGFKNKNILIDVKGEKVGVINALSVIQVGDYSFGKPNVITVTTGMGRRGIVNIEREVELSGSIYDKGVLILTGFLQEQFSQEGPLSLSAYICFEQSYGGVDGDSASSTELYGILSSLSATPIKQYLAVTGSVNQKGYIQPVGGVTDKIEGFFSVCKSRGLTGKQGVVIPEQNIENLMLSEEIIEAVREGSFHIYGIKHVNEGIKLLMGESHEVIYERIKNRLEKYRSKQKED